MTWRIQTDLNFQLYKPKDNSDKQVFKLQSYILQINLQSLIIYVMEYQNYYQLVCKTAA